MTMARKIIIAGIAAVGLVGATAGPAVAAAPGNDIARRAVPVSLDLTLRQDTTEATTDQTDARVNARCGAPATDASVWYSYAAAASGAVVVDVSRSTYSAGVIVTTGGSNGLVACGPGSVLFTTEPGVTYYILAFDDQNDGGGNGGDLVISFIDGGGIPAVSLAVSPNGRVDAAGDATIHGTYSCENGNGIELSGSLLQLRARAITGSFDVVETGTCDGTVRTWQTVVTPDDGRFTTDKALVTSFGFTCGQFLCSEGYAERVIRLRAAP